VEFETTLGSNVPTIGGGSEALMVLANSDSQHFSEKILE
jgi:hypothetical protein